jgi:hypothetical protein
MLLSDAKDAPAWKGEDDGRFEVLVDIGAEMPSKKCRQPLGEGHCVLASCAQDTQIFLTQNGLAWLNFHAEGKVTAKVRTLLRESIETVKTKGKPRLLGVLVVRSGILAIVPLDVAGSKLKEAPTSHLLQKGTLFVPLAPGTYEVNLEGIEREGDGGYFESRIRIEQAG